MAYAQIFSRFQTTLGASYTAGATSMTWNSKPTGLNGGDFWFVVEAEGSNTEEIFYGSAISGSGPYTLTVVGAKEGTASSNHANGASVQGFIIGLDAIKQVRADQQRVLTCSQFDALTDGTGTSVLEYLPGDRVRFSDAPGYEAVRGVSAWTYFHAGQKAKRPPTSGWSWVNQGAATVDESKIAIVLTAPAGSTDNIRARSRSLPAAPYNILVKLSAELHGHQYPAAGLALRQSSDGKLVTFSLLRYAGAPRFDLQKRSGPTNYTASYPSVFDAGAAYTANGNMVADVSAGFWIQLSDTNTNREIYMGLDPGNLTKYYGHSRTDYASPDQFCLAADTNNGSVGTTVVRLLSYEEF